MKKQALLTVLLCAVLVLTACNRKIETVEVNEDFFAEQINDIQYRNPDFFNGKQFSYEGYVYLLNDKDRLAGRTADFAVCRNLEYDPITTIKIGLGCKYNGQTPEADAWVRVTGIIIADIMTNYDGSEEEYAYLKVTKLEILPQRGNDTIYN